MKVITGENEKKERKNERKKDPMVSLRSMNIQMFKRVVDKTFRKFISTGVKLIS